MRNKLFKICAVIAYLLLFTRCTDEPLISDAGNGTTVELQLTISLPGNSSTRATRVGGELEYDDGTDETTDLQRYIGNNDAYVLLFETVDGEEVLAYAPAMTVSGRNGDELRVLKGSLTRSDEEISSMEVLVNLAQNGLFGESSVDGVQGKLESMIGLTKEAVHEALIFNYPEANETNNPYGVWTISTSAGGRYLPMWGSPMDANGNALSFSLNNNISTSCALYRSVAKMGVTVDSGCENFTLQEVRVFYINEEGYVASSMPLSQTVNIQYTLPDVPSTSTQAQRTKDNPLVYDASEDVNGIAACLDQIYVTESDNISGTGEKLVMLVGGYYTGDGIAASNELSYYRIDMTDNSGTGGAQSPFDIVRNHSYIFNILEVNNPGTPDPDPDKAVADIVVEVLDYEEVQMEGINSIYTLSVNQSLFGFEGITVNPGYLYITTDGTTWALEPDEAGGTTGTDSWITLVEQEHTATSGTVIITPAANTGNGSSDATRSGYFWITAGKIRKRITIVQGIDETANSYIVTEPGNYTLKVDAMGNGVTSAYVDDAEIDTINIAFGYSFSRTDIASVAIIWETAQGLITIDSSNTLATIQQTGCISYTVNNVSTQWGRAFASGSGGNALIGAYDSSGTLLWTWHIWVCPDYANGELTESWYSGYEFMDRNLGAVSNLPGSGSFGLLYQWGRISPFIGAYREANERDYHRLPKQDCPLYSNPKTGAQWAWVDYDDAGNISSQGGEGNLVKYAFQHPTSLFEDGLLSSDHNTEWAHALWGTESDSHTARDNGEKTMYDPCPPGFRVPTLNALTVSDGTNDMWTGTTAGAVQHASRTLRYVPISSATGNDFRTGGYSSNFISDAPFYGFWLDYNNTGTFATDYDAGVYDVGYYDPDATIQAASYGYIDGYTGTKPAWATWIPLAGIYNGSMDHFGRAGMTDVIGNEGNYLPASSLQVTSVLWAASPTTTNTNYPGGLLLHGTEGAYTPHSTSTGTLYRYSPGDYSTGATANTLATEGEGFWTTATTGYSTSASGYWIGTDQSGQWKAVDPYFPTNATKTTYWYDENGLPGGGRHFHSFSDPSISTLANPSYAASVRCIRDKDRVITADDQIYMDDGVTAYDGSPITLYTYDYNDGDTSRDAINLVVFSVESWEVTNPGAKWISVTPTEGNSDEANGDYTTIVIMRNLNYTSTVTEGSTATITIRFARGSTKTITVVYGGTTSPQQP